MPDTAGEAMKPAIRANRWRCVIAADAPDPDHLSRRHGVYPEMRAARLAAINGVRAEEIAEFSQDRSAGSLRWTAFCPSGAGVKMSERLRASSFAICRE